MLKLKKKFDNDSEQTQLHYPPWTRKCFSFFGTIISSVGGSGTFPACKNDDSNGTIISSVVECAHKLLHGQRAEIVPSIWPVYGDLQQRWYICIEQNMECKTLVIVIRNQQTVKVLALGESTIQQQHFCQESKASQGCRGRRKKESSSPWRCPLPRPSRRRCRRTPSPTRPWRRTAPVAPSEKYTTKCPEWISELHQQLIVVSLWSNKLQNVQTDAQTCQIYVCTDVHTPPLHILLSWHGNVDC